MIQAIKGFESLFASFKRDDELGGTIKMHKSAPVLGLKFKMPIGKFDLGEIGSNQVY